jgi:hypothetical protein
MEPSMKVLVKKWDETKYLGSIFKETKEKGGTSSRTHDRINAKETRDHSKNQQSQKLVL